MSLINSDDRFTRWQSVLRQQVTFTNNLLLTISIGISGFMFGILNSKEFEIYCEEEKIIKYGLLFILISVTFGIITNFSRLIDFRLTLKKIKQELKNELISTTNKTAMKVFGNITWFLFYSQIITMTIGTIILSIGLYKIYF